MDGTGADARTGGAVPPLPGADSGSGSDGDPPSAYAKLETPIKVRTREFARQDTFDSDKDVEHTRAERTGTLASTVASTVSTTTVDPGALPRPSYRPDDFEYGAGHGQPSPSRVSGADLVARDIDHGRRVTAETKGRGGGDPTENTVHLSSMQLPDADATLPNVYLSGKFQMNSYFSIRLLRMAQFLAVVDVLALVAFYFYRRDRTIEHGGLWVPSPMAMVLSREHSCRTTVALAALVYHLVPAVVVMGLPASGLRVFEPFRREQRVDRVGRLQKVKRTIFLQVCELVGVVIFIYMAFITGLFVYFFTSGRLFADCDDNVAVYIFCSGALCVYALLFVLMRCFARFREHLKMQLGAFKESDQTGDVKAHMLRSKLRRKKRQQLKRQASAANGDTAAANAGGITMPSRSQLVQDIRKRLFRGAQLGDLRLIRRTIRIARTNLGDAFARDLYADPAMVFGVFGLAKKNPMHVAAYQGNIQAMDVLLRAGFDVNAFDKVSRVRFSTGDIFWYLASYFIPKPVVSADESYSSIFKTTLVTPLHCAVSTGRLGAVCWLVEHGADVNLCSKSSYRCEGKLPPIFLADNPEIVRALLRAGANHLAIPDPGHMNTITVLQLAYLRGNYAVAQVLEDWGGDVALTPLHAAAAMNDVAKIRSLLRKKVSPDCLGELGYVGLNKRTPLHWAAVNGAGDAVEILLDARANANFQDAHGRTALHWAARVNRVDIVRVLLEHGADPNIVDDGGMTAILCAACAGGTTADMFRALTASGGDINFQLRATGDTALHLAVKLDDQQTALALLSLGGDIMRTNHDGLRPIDCTTSTRLQFEIKRAAGTRDVMVSYTHSHKEFALKLRKSLEDANITVWLDLMDPSGIGGGAVWREEIARGITNAAVVLCILTEDYTQSEWCLKELALAKQVGTPIMAISTERAQISEELQVYLYTRQLVPFESAITSVEVVSDKEIRYEYDEDAYRNQLRMLLDGMRDEIEKRKADHLKRNMRRQETLQASGSSSHNRRHMLQHVASGGSSKLLQGGDSMRFDERALEQSAAFDSGNNSVFDSSRSMDLEATGYIGAPAMPVSNSRGRHRTGIGGAGSNRSIQSVGSNGGAASGRGRRLNFEMGGTMSRVSSTSSMSSSVTDDYGVSDSIVMDTGGYYFHQPNLAEFQKHHGTIGENDSIVESYQELATATAGGEQFVFICHGDHHQRFVRKLCVELCREGGLRCFVDRKHLVNDGDDANAASTSSAGSSSSSAKRPHRDEDLSRRIHEAKEAILKCSAFVVIISEKTLASELVKDQLAFAEDKGKKILPVVVNRLEFSLDMKYSLARSEFFHFFTQGDMMGFDKSLERILDTLREEVYGISVDTRQPGSAVGVPTSTSSFRSFGPPTNSIHSLRGGFDELRESFLSVGGASADMNPYEAGFRPTTNASLRRRRMSSPTNNGAYALGSARGDGGASNFGLPPMRLSQSFVEASAVHATNSTRGMASDMSLSHSMIGNFSSLVGRISDELDEEDELLDDPSYAGMQDDDDLSDDGADMSDEAAMSSTRTWAQRSPPLPPRRHHHVIGIINEDGDFEAGRRTEQPRSGSISILEELTDSNDAVTNVFDAMLAEPERSPGIPARSPVRSPVRSPARSPVKKQQQQQR